MTELYVVQTCRSAGRLLLAGSIVEVDDDTEAERLLAADLARHPVDGDVPPAPPPPEVPLTPRQTREEWRSWASDTNRLTALEVLFEDLLERLEARH
ncbi:MAG: hypothetical protein WBY94_18665 [Polyangiaceae bacterium]